jgi:hypothetical protein
MVLKRSDRASGAKNQREIEERSKGEEPKSTEPTEE